MKSFDTNNYVSSFIEKSLNGSGDSDRHLITLFSIALSSKAKTIVELGVRRGDTTLPLLLAAKMNGGFLHSVDIQETEFKAPNELKESWVFYKKDSLSFLESWDKSQTPDLVYVDDWHSYDHVKEQLNILDKIVSPNTVILLHDLMYGETCPYYHTDLTLKDGQWGNGGPYRAVAELNSQFWEFSTLPWNNGLTLLRKKYSSKYKR